VRVCVCVCVRVCVCARVLQMDILKSHHCPANWTPPREDLETVCAKRRNEFNILAFFVKFK